MIRFILKKIIPLLFCLIIALGYVCFNYTSLSEGPGAPADFCFMQNDIYIDGIHINNYQLEHPVMIMQIAEPDELTVAAGDALDPEEDFNQLIFVPLDSVFQKALGLEIIFNQEQMSVEKTDSLAYPAPEDLRFQSCAIDTSFSGEPYADLTAFLLDGHQSRILDYASNIGRHKYYVACWMEENIDDYVNPYGKVQVLNLKSSDYYICEGVVYARLSALCFIEQFRLSFCYEDVTGLYISSSNTPAEKYISETNKAYIEGRAEYMLNYQKELDHDTAYYLEYLFRKGATINGVSEDMLLAQARAESAYKFVTNKKSGTVGYMQIMPSTALANGYDLEYISTPEGNIEFGSWFIAQRIAGAKGNMIMGITAYAYGTGAVAAGNYSTDYAEKILRYMNTIQTWVNNNDYSNTFLEVIEAN